MNSILKIHSRILNVFFSILLTITLISCGGDDDNNGLLEPSASSGFFILNEGAFGNSNTSLSFYSIESGSISNNVFQTTNNRPLGDQSQSMNIHDGKGYIVVQNSAKIEIINIDNFESIATISDNLSSPRYFVGLNSEKAYVSDWGDGFNGVVHVIDLNTYSVTKTINAGSGSNEMVIRDGKLYVANAGGFGVGNSISVISTDTDEVIKTIDVNDNPSNLELDDEGNIWVLGKGNLAFDADFNLVEEESTSGYLIRLNESDEITFTADLEEITFSTADDLVINESNDKLYFNFNGAVWSQDMTSNTASLEIFISKNLYGLAVDPTTGNLIGSEAPDFSSGGNVIFYDATGSATNTITVGIAPNSLTYKN